MFTSIIDNIIRNHARTNYEEVEVKAGKCRYNQKCHVNSVHDAIRSDQDQIAMMITIDTDDNEPFIHFVNVNHDDEFVDNTFGEWCRTYEYYLIKYVNKDDYFDIIKIFVNYRKELHSILPWRIRIFSSGKY